MTSTYSPDLRLQLMGTGDQSNTWGSTTNTNLDLIDGAISGMAAITVTNANVTLTAYNGAADQARQMILIVSGANTGVFSITAPSGVSKVYVVANQTTGGYPIIMTTGVSGGQNALVSPGEVLFVACDGTDMYLVSDTPPGTVSYFAANSTPPGWLKAEGQAVSRTTYGALFTTIGTTFGAGDGSTTFNLPDLRGYFVRCWADGGTVDSGRIFGSTQAYANASHSHLVSDPGHTHAITDPGHSHGVNDPAHSHGYTEPVVSATYFIAPQPGGSLVSYTSTSAAATNNAFTGITLNSSATGVYNGTSATGVTTQSSGGAEARPVNIALLACIKV